MRADRAAHKITSTNSHLLAALLWPGIESANGDTDSWKMIQSVMDQQTDTFEPASLRQDGGDDQPTGGERRSELAKADTTEPVTDSTAEPVTPRDIEPSAVTATPAPDGEVEVKRGGSDDPPTTTDRTPELDEVDAAAEPAAQPVTPPASTTLEVDIEDGQIVDPEVKSAVAAARQTAVALGSETSDARVPSEAPAWDPCEVTRAMKAPKVGA